LDETKSSLKCNLCLGFVKKFDTKPLVMIMCKYENE